MTRHFIDRFAAIAMAVALLVGAVAPVSAAVWTDQADYSPGSVVMISGDNSNGAGYLPGETVHVDVAGPNGYTSSCDATADENGAWSCQVTLWDSDLAVGDYSYTATGLTSSVTETGTFTDANKTFSTATTLNFSATSIGVGGSVTLSGALDWTATSPNQGQQTKDGRTIHLNRYSASNCGGTATFIADATTSGGGASGAASYSYPYSPSSAGTQYIQASFDGFVVGSSPNRDTYQSSNSTCQQLVVDAAPSVSSATPTNGATGVQTNANVSITFSEAVTVTAGWYDITCGDSGNHAASQSGGPTTFTLNPSVDFDPNESCTVTVYAANVTDNDTIDPPDNMTADYVFSFETDAAPEVLSTSPADGATGVAVNANITINFSEDIHATGTWFDITCTSSGNHAATVSGSNTSKTLDPGSDFAPGEDCTVTVYAANVQDNDTDDPPDNMLADKVFSFTTVDATAPSNVSIDINGGAAWTNSTAATLHIHGEDNVGVTGYFVANGGTATCLAEPFGSYTGVGPTTSYDNAALAHALTSGDGTKTACVVFRDAAGNKTAAQDTIGLDQTAPGITKSIPGTPHYNDGSNDFVTSGTNLRVNVTEAGSGLDSCTISIDGPGTNDTNFSCSTGDNDFTLGGALTSPPDGSYVISVDATDNAGNPGSDPLTVILDNTAPDNYAETLGSPNYFDGSSTWVTSATNISVSGDDGSGSGVASCSIDFDSAGSPAAYTLGTNFNMPSGDGAHDYAIVCEDNLGNTNAALPDGATRYVDDTGPVVTLTGVTDGATYILGSVPVAGCNTSDGTGVGVATYATLIGPSGLSPNGVGTATGSCGGATDLLGNPQSPDPFNFTFHVIYDPAGISGILQPINPDNTSVFKRGQAIPVKFRLGGDEFFGFVTTDWLIQRQNVACSVFDGQDATLETVPSNTPSQYFRYDASADQYIYNADMHNLGAGTCWNFKVTLDSGQILYSAVFKLTK